MCLKEREGIGGEKREEGKESRGKEKNNMKTLFLYTLFLLFPPYKMYFLKIFSVPLSLP
jgi:hypothetical protein